MRSIKLYPLNLQSAQDQTDLINFVNKHYLSPFPLSDDSLLSGKTAYYWARLADSGEVVGVSGYYAKTPFLAETVKTVVDPQWRGQGFGAAISHEIEQEVARKGFKKIMTTIYIHNLPMIFIKLKQGYIFEGFHPHHEKPGLHEYSFGKLLGTSPLENSTNP